MSPEHNVQGNWHQQIMMDSMDCDDSNRNSMLQTIKTIIQGDQGDQTSFRKGKIVNPFNLTILFSGSRRRYWQRRLKCKMYHAALKGQEG